MWALRYPQIHPFMGLFPGRKPSSRRFGGIGSIRGRSSAACSSASHRNHGGGLFPTLSKYRDAFAFVLLIIILLMKPTGLMGEKLEDKI